VNINIDDVREAIKGCPEFFEKEEDDLIIFNYRFCSGRSFPSPESAEDERTKLLRLIKREVRGLVFSKSDKKVAARRFHKFFNIGELPETQPEKIDLSRPYYVLTKYDGKLVSPVKTNGKIRFASKSGFGEVTKNLEERFFSVEENKKYLKFSEHWLGLDFSPIFEWCSPRSKIVLYYETDTLVLTAIRSHVNGTYIPYLQMVESAKSFGIPITEMHPGHLSDLNLFLQSAQAKTEIEGVVIRFEDDGSMYKVKTQWYFDRSRKEKQEFSFNSERSIWIIILEQQIDDALAFINDTHLSTKVREFEIILYDAIASATETLSQISEKYKHLGKKEYVEAIRKDPDVLVEAQPILFKLKETVPANRMNVVLKFIRDNCNNPNTLEKSRKILGGITFSEIKTLPK